MNLPTMTSTPGKVAPIHFINNPELTHAFSWVVVNKGPIFWVLTPLSFPLWIINSVALLPYYQTPIHAAIYIK